MLIKKWNSLPEELKCDEVRIYYEVLRKKQCSLIIKRVFDFVCSLCMLIILSPIFLILICWIRLDSKGTAFYRQERVTQYGKIFKIYKFRTMVNDADKIGALVTTEHDARITKVGKKIRKCRLDELPQLINVLLGDMTFVGTRPEVKKYVDQYTNEMKVTLLLPAGITSLSSLYFKDEDAILAKFKESGESIDSIYMTKVLPKKMEYNLQSIEHVGLLSDFQVCFKTVIGVSH